MNPLKSIHILGGLILLASAAFAACGEDDPSGADPAGDGGAGGGGAARGEAGSPDGPTTGTGGAGGSTSTASATSTGTGGAASVELANTNLGASCTESNSVGPILPGEKGHLYATRLTPTSYPVTIDSVEYVLVDNAACDATLTHHVHFMVTTDTAPSATPGADSTLAEQAVITPPGLVDGTAKVHHSLTTPITLAEGESLVVAVEMEADLATNRAVCLEICEDTQKPTFDYWSNAAAEPYAWDDLVTVFGILANSTVRAFGSE